MTDRSQSSLEERIRKWDAGDLIWTIDMGGMGPGYEQAIQIASIEYLRDLLPGGFSDFDNKDALKAEDERVEALCMPRLESLGLSGAQWGAARSLAWCLYRRGEEAMEEVKDRKIMASNGFPTLEAQSQGSEAAGPSSSSPSGL